MATSVLIVDYHKPRLDHLRELLRVRFPEWSVDHLLTSPGKPGVDTDTGRLAQVRAHKYDLLIGHLGGNPSGYECLRVFKAASPNGRALLYTKLEAIPLRQLDGLKLADKVFRRSEQDDKLFDNADEMFDTVASIMKTPPVGYRKQPLTDPKVLTVVVTLLTSIVALVTALVKLKE